MSGSGDTSIWKKEISFRRKPKAAPAPSVPPAPEQRAKPGETSVWKKEVTFRRKPKAAPAPSVPPAPAQPVAELPRPLVEEPLDPIAVPPLPPLVAAPAATQLPPTPAPEPEDAAVDAAAYATAPEAEAAGFQPSDPVVLPPVTPPVVVPAEPQPPSVPEPEAEEAEPDVDEPVLALEAELTTIEPELEPEPEPKAMRERKHKPTRRERKDARRAADRLAKEQRKQAEEERKALPNLHNRVVGLKIGASQIAAAQVVNKGGPRIVRMARMPLERGIVVGGELRQPEELAAALKTFFRKNKLPRTCVRLGVSNTRIGVRTFELTGIDDPKQLANAIRFRAQETLPIPLDEAVLDYRILEDRIGADGVRVRRVLLVVAHRELVARYVAACRKAGLKLIGIDLDAFALLRALGDPARPPAAEDAGLVCVSIGHDRSTLAISDGRVCEFTRVLAWGGSALDVAIARALDLAPSEAEPLKRELSLGEQGTFAGLDARWADEARRAVAAELQVFARELVASLRFYQEQPGSLGIGEILVTGGGAACGGFAEELERLIGVPVRIADPLARIKMPRKLRKSLNGSAGSLAVAVGLGIED